MNHLFCEYCKQNSIIHINPFSHGKAEFIERLNATIQKLLLSHMLENGDQNFLSVLEEVVHTYNTRPLRMLGKVNPVMRDQRIFLGRLEKYCVHILDDLDVFYPIFTYNSSLSI